MSLHSKGESTNTAGFNVYISVFQDNMAETQFSVNFVIHQHRVQGVLKSSNCYNEHFPGGEIEAHGI